MALEDKEKERMILLLAMCKLTGVNTFAGAVYGALVDAENAVNLFEQAITDPD